MGGNEGQTVELTQEFLIKPISGPVFFNKAKCENDKIMQIDSQWKFSNVEKIPSVGMDHQ